jgi:hypothetical protein
LRLVAVSCLSTNGDKRGLLATVPGGMEQWTRDERLAALGLAQRLADTAYSLCDAARDGKHAEQDVARLLREARPGFLDAAYAAALSAAWYQTMW